MRYITNREVEGLCISPAECVNWVEDAFLHKSQCILSPKISQKPTPDSFFNTMPCCIPAFNRMGVKVVSRLPGNMPALKSFLNLFDLTSGDLLAVMEADWITAMRTGAVAALAAKTFVNNFGEASFGFVGLGSTAIATLKCLDSQVERPGTHVWLLEYKERAPEFARMLSGMTRFDFHIAKTKKELVSHTEALFSCVTVMNEQFLPPEKFPSGYTLIPVHTKGFQDCDSAFDHIFGDDKGHICGFRHFSEFRTFAEIGDVLSGISQGRETSDDRIISYNVGIGLHDVWFASKIYERLLA